LSSLPYKKNDYFATTKKTKLFSKICNSVTAVNIPNKTQVIYLGEVKYSICANGSKWRKVSLNGKEGYINDNDLSNILPLYSLVNGDKRARVITRGGDLPIRDYNLTGPTIGEFRNGTLVFIESIKPPVKINGVVSYPVEVQDGHYQGIVDMKYLVSFEQ
jgi:hypothetical protein